MMAYGYIQCQENHTLFVNRQGSKVTTLIVYVDDTIVTRNDEAEMKELECYIAKEFEIKDLGKHKHFLGKSLKKVFS